MVITLLAFRLHTGFQLLFLMHTACIGTEALPLGCQPHKFFGQGSSPNSFAAFLKYSPLVSQHITSPWLFSVAQNSIVFPRRVTFKALLVSLTGLLAKTILPRLVA